MATLNPDLFKAIMEKEPSPGFKFYTKNRLGMSVYRPVPATKLSGKTATTAIIDEADSIDPDLFDTVSRKAVTWDDLFDTAEKMETAAIRSGISKEEAERMAEVARQVQESIDEDTQESLRRALGIQSPADLEKEKAEFYKQQETTGIY